MAGDGTAKGTAVQLQELGLKRASAKGHLEPKKASPHKAGLFSLCSKLMCMDALHI